MMHRRFTVAALLLACALFASPAAADIGGPLPSFSADIQLHADGSALIAEVISVRFDDQRHGIYRVIPYRYRDERGELLSVPVHVESVERNDASEPYTVSTEGDDVRVKIGDADQTVTGTQVYTITYRVDAVVNFLTDTDEFYWNVTGSDWKWSFASVVAELTPPDGTVLTTDAVRCFTGATGSTEGVCETQRFGASVSVTADDLLTVVAQFPKGVFTKPANYDALRAGAVPFVERYQLGIVVANGLVALLGISWVLWRWLRGGRDPRGKGTIIAQYDPPVGASPGAVGVLMDERADMKDVSAALVHLAVQGYLTITEVEEKHLLRATKDYRLDRQDPSRATRLPAHEQALLDGLFPDGSRSVVVSELRKSFAVTLATVRQKLYQEVVSLKYFPVSPHHVRLVYGISGVVLAGATFAFMVFAWGLTVVGAAIAIGGFAMPRRTAAGVEALWHARGFKLFLETAERYRLQWQEREHIFEQYLPYAMVFGVADKWAKALATLNVDQQQVSWYHSTNALSTVALASALSSSLAPAVARAGSAASGGSGSSGGFSGGGFGGGGGGSW